MLASTSLGFSPIPQHGSSLAMASLNLGWDTAYTRGLRQLASLAEIVSLVSVVSHRRILNIGREEV